nr:Aldehyde dehydrogenase family 16 member like [Ipomoea batatas]
MMLEEISAGDFGQGELDNSTYPISSSKVATKIEDEVLKERSSSRSCDEINEESSRVIKFTIPKGELDNNEIHKLVKDEMHEAFLLLKRDMSVITSVHMERVMKLREQMKGKAPESSTQCQLSQDSQLFFRDSKVLEYVDQVVENFLAMKKLSEAMPSFDLLTPDEENDDRMANITAENDGDGGIEDHMLLLMNGSRVMLTVGEFHLNIVLAAGFKNALRYVSENVFAFDGEYFIPWNDIATLNNNDMICTTVIDGWCLLMNRTQDSMKCYFFGIGFSIFIPIYMNKHYFVAVINFGAKKVQCLDNRKRDQDTSAKYISAIKRLQLLMGKFLESKSHKHAGDVLFFDIENVSFKWQTKRHDIDCGVYMMHHMRSFRGEVYHTPELFKSPYFLHSSHGTGTTLVVNLLTGIDNYYPWSLAMTMALKGRNKFCFVDGTLPTPPAIDPHHARWHRVNNMVMSWLLNSIHPSLAHTVLYAPNAATVWADLKERFSTANSPRIYDLERRIATIRQQDYSIADYHNILCALWDELTLLDPPPICTCSARTAYASQMEWRRLFQFLMGLRDTYTQTRSNLFLKTTMPTVTAAYSLLLQDEAQRIIYQSDSPATSVALQTTAHGKSSLSSNVPLSSVVPSTTVDTSILGKYPPPLQMTCQTNEMTPSFANVSHQPYTRSTQTRSRPKCTNCGLLGHTQQMCYKLHGYPQGHKYYKKGNTNGIPSSTPKPPPPITGSISSDSIQQLLHLLREVKEPKANLASMSLTLAFIFNASTEWVIDTRATDHDLSTKMEIGRGHEPRTNPKWQKAMEEEIQALEAYNTWSLQTLPPRKTTIGCRWVYRIKYKPDRIIERYKARLVAKGYSQLGVDYTDVFAQ